MWGCCYIMHTECCNKQSYLVVIVVVLGDRLWFMRARRWAQRQSINEVAYFYLQSVAKKNCDPALFIRHHRSNSSPILLKICSILRQQLILLGLMISLPQKKIGYVLVEKTIAGPMKSHWSVDARIIFLSIRLYHHICAKQAANTCPPINWKKYAWMVVGVPSLYFNRCDEIS